jgi:6,7-dimethyl-8-ribityllumazine synthase
MRVHDGSGGAGGRRFAVVVSRFNQPVTSRLLDGALDAFRRQDVAEEDLEVVWAPGAFEIPSIALRLARSEGFDAIVCLGAVIRGETAHFDYVAGECARGVQRVALETGVPCLFGVLTTDTVEQAVDRAGGQHGNKGWDAAMAAVAMANLVDSLPKREG